MMGIWAINELNIMEREVNYCTTKKFRLSRLKSYIILPNILVLYGQELLESCQSNNDRITECPIFRGHCIFADTFHIPKRHRHPQPENKLSVVINSSDKAISFFSSHLVQN
jgi:hypothetical protein